MFFLHKSIYTTVGWGQRALYKALKAFIHPDTREKIVLSGERNPRELLELFHPDQLEQRFGGNRPTPTNFWPPYIGNEFIPDSEKEERICTSTIKLEDYDRVLEENPELHVHPLHF